MKSVTAAEMKEIDRQAIEDYGIPSLVLMENAGRAVTEIVLASERGNRIAVLAGAGNNAGDGFVATRHLYNSGFEVRVFCLADPSSFTADAKINYEIIRQMKIPCETLYDHADLVKLDCLGREVDILIDALFGIGLNREVSGLFRSVIERINDEHVCTISIDTPSGLNADTGDPMGVAIKANQTIALGLAKQGLLKKNAALYVGELDIADIGLPRDLLQV